jgi:Lhr-like helicase
MNERDHLAPQVNDAFFGNFPSLLEVQKSAIKPLIQGRNVVACSGTGSGKTEAALVPLMSRYWKEFDKSIPPQSSISLPPKPW